MYSVSCLIVVCSCLIYVVYVYFICRLTFLFPEDGYSMPESWELNNLIFTMFISALVLGFIIKLSFPKNTSVRDVVDQSECTFKFVNHNAYYRIFYFLY